MTMGPPNERKGVTYLCWTDYSGLLRCRGIPSARLERIKNTGLGWAMAGFALTSLERPAPNPWGPMFEVRQVPVAETGLRLALWPERPALDLVLCRTLDQAGEPWDCCPRAFCETALQRLWSQHRLKLNTAFEHEFTLLDTPFTSPNPFSIEAMRLAPGFVDDLAEALERAALMPEGIEPEAGLRQYEVVCGPGAGLAGVDRAILTREVIREVARHHSFHASFSPKPFTDKIGSGAHVHFSLSNEEGRNVTGGDGRASKISALAESFVAGIIKYLRSIAVFVASNPVSYLRLGPSNWSCGYTSFGLQNREAALRVCPPPAIAKAGGDGSINIEFRPLDATANVYLAIGAMVRAGLQGIEEQLPLPYLLDRDPNSLTTAEREWHGIHALPGSLHGALQAMAAEPVVRSWMSDQMFEAFASVKQTEIALTADLEPRQLAETFLRVF